MQSNRCFNYRRLNGGRARNSKGVMQFVKFLLQLNTAPYFRIEKEMEDENSAVKNIQTMFEIVMR